MNNQDIISRSALIAEFERIYTEHYKCTVYQFIHDIFKAMFRRLKNAPAVDAVEVVRCKDCKHRRNDEDYASGHYCVKRPSNGGYFCEDNDFCSYGERRSE